MSVDLSCNSSPLKGKRITLIVTGSIAAFKSCEVVGLLRKNGATVEVVLTKAAETFITPLTLEALSGNPVHTESNSHGLNHIRLSQNCDLILVAPASANTIAKAAYGIADNLATEILLARTVPVAFAPAMNTAMWENRATVRNVALLKGDGAKFIGPASGALACGKTGAGRMTEPKEILEAVEAILSKKTLQDKKVLVTAGPTFEAIDPVRGLTNHSSGKQGYAVAKAAFEAGADVTLITGPTAIDAPYGVRLVRVTTAKEMANAVAENLANIDAFISVAAVADWRPAKESAQKIKKSECPTPTLLLEANPDILRTVTASENRPRCVVGFAAETEDEIRFAKEKLQAKGLDLIVANNATDTFGKGTNSVTFITANAVDPIGKSDKITLARALIERIARILEN